MGELETSMPDLRRGTIADIVGRIDGEIRVLEIGTARNVSESAERSDGWSTKRWAEHAKKRGGRVYSIDILKDAIKASKEIVPEELHEFVEWHVCDGPGPFVVKNPCANPNIVYLDAGDDPMATLCHFGLCMAIATRPVHVLIDDTQGAHGNKEGKGAYILDLARRHGWHVEHFCGMGYRMSLVVVK